MFCINRIFCYVQNIPYTNNTEYSAKYRNIRCPTEYALARCGRWQVLLPPNIVIFPSWTEHSGNEIKYRNILLVTETSQIGRMYFGRIFWSEVFGQNVDRNSIRWITAAGNKVWLHTNTLRALRKIIRCMSSYFFFSIFSWTAIFSHLNLKIEKIL